MSSNGDELPTESVEDRSRKSERTKTLSLKGKENKHTELTKTLWHLIQAQSKTNLAIETELKSASSFDQLKQIEESLQTCLKPVTEVFLELQSIEAHTIDHDLRKSVDRLTRDNQFLCDMF